MFPRFGYRGRTQLISYSGAPRTPPNTPNYQRPQLSAPFRTHPMGPKEYYEPHPRAQVGLRTANEREQFLEALGVAGSLKFREKALSSLQEVMLRTLKDLRTEMKPIIDKIVPRATGQLRNSLYWFLKHDLNIKAGGYALDVVVGSYVPYLRYVAAMNTMSLRHRPPQRRWVKYYGAPRYVILNDPMAEGGFFETLILEARAHLASALARNIRSVAARYRTDPVIMRQYLQITEMNG